MNDVLKAIKERRAVRAYESRKVSKEIINIIIDAGNNAPSGMNSQPWRFVVVEDDDIHKKLTGACIPNVKNLLDPLKISNPERYDMIMKRFEELEDPIYYSAPVMIFVIGKGPYADLSCPLACENMMLAAFSLGLGSCWVAFGSLFSDNTELMNTLELKKNEKIFGPIIIGYPKGKTEPPEKKVPEIKWI